MKVIKENSAEDFLNKNEEYLLKRESEYNLILGLSGAILKAKMLSENPLFYTVFEGDAISGQAIRTNPDKPLAIAYMNDNAVANLVKRLQEDNVILQGVVGPIEVAKKFTELWKTNSNIGMHQGIYQLDSVIHPEYDSGNMRLATFDDHELVRSLSLGFIQDCFPGNESKEKEADEAANSNLKNKTLYLWLNKNYEIVSMAGKNRESKNGATISWVYTPIEFRNHGYASKVVASLSQKILDEGKLFCNLFTDLLNPTSNSIYQKVGYRKVGESMHLQFFERA